MVQIENEYGSFGACDDTYKAYLKDIFERHVGQKAVLFTTDGVWGKMLTCGTIPGVFKTIDFGVTNDTHPYFLKLRQFQPKVIHSRLNVRAQFSNFFYNQELLCKGKKLI